MKFKQFKKQIKYNEKDLLSTISNLQDSLNDSTNNEQKCLSVLNNINTMQQLKHNTQNRFLEKIRNPLVNPDTIYPGNYDSYNIFQQIGFVTGDAGRFPIFGRWHDTRGNKWEYYMIDDSRNHIKIPLKTKNFNELYDGDSVSTEMGTLTFKKYDTEQYRYDPYKF